MEPDARKIVVVGGSFGGINAAYSLRRELGRRAEITVVSREAEFTYLPSLPWVILGWRDPRRLQVPLEKPLARRGIRFLHTEALELDPDKGQLRTTSATLAFDIVVIASGAELDWAAVPGLDPAGGYIHSTFSASEATRARDALAQVLRADSGRIVIGAAPGASCIGPAYEIVMMIDTVLRRARRRHRFSLSLLTPEPFIGHFGVGGIGMAPRMIQDELAERHVDCVVNARIAEARPGRLTLADGSEHAFDFALVIPSFVGAPFVRGVEGLANPKGFVTVTPQLASQKFRNVYAVGVAIAIAPPGPTPVPVAVPKTGHMTELMAHAAAHNIKAELDNGTPIDGLSLPVICIADAGDTAFYLSADPFLPPRNRVVHKRGRWARWLKVAFEKYYLGRIRHDWPAWHFGW